MPRDEGAPRRTVERVYGPLGDYLAARAAAGERRVTLTFAAIEGLLGRPLPASARAPRAHRAWWHGSTGHAANTWHGWARHGWQVATVDLAAETVTFARSGEREGGRDGCGAG